MRTPELELHEAAPDIPDADGATGVAGDDLVEDVIVQGADDRRRVRAVRLDLNAHRQDVQCAGAQQEPRKLLVQGHARQTVLGLVLRFVREGLDASVVLEVPDFDDLIHGHGHQLVLCLVNLDIQDRRAVALQVVHRHLRIWIPDDDLAVETTGGEALVELAPAPGVYSILLVQPDRRLVGLPLVEVHVAQVDLPVEPAGHHCLQVVHKANLGDPTIVVLRPDRLLLVLEAH
mmetsp:Transcript_82554/g.238582  ORF Transcript_82554/g.238582 Transcript_82554/m.238582 type:complete len:232 (+) Transcript_82554:708-1403(+)